MAGRLSSALIVVGVAIFGSYCWNGISHPPLSADYVFPEGFRGGWFLIPDSTMPAQGTRLDYVLRFDTRGICRVDPATFERLHDPADTVCDVGSKVVYFEHPSDWKVGMLSCLGSYDVTTEPELAKTIPYFYDGLIGDRKDLYKPQAGSSPSARLSALLSEEASKHS